MAREGYALQSAIYLVALHRYLGQRISGYDPARHLGGAFYLFMRGMDPARGPECGVHYEQYDPALLKQLDRMIGR